MNALFVENITKDFTTTRAVDHLSFQVEYGEIFAMLGPNGAGKTTTIRMALDILKPDSGSIQVFDGPINQAAKDRIGYLPEERGLYRNISVLDCLTYLGNLKGMNTKVAKTRAMKLLERVGLGEYANHKVSELSRGMQQKAQFASTIMHDPDLVIIDEPFSGLDPVNTLLVKELMYELKAEGKSIIMATHVMERIEEMADRLLMMNHGQRVLYGPVEQVRQDFAQNAVIVQGQGDWQALSGIERVKVDDKATLLFLQEGVTSDDILGQAARSPDYQLTRFEIALPSLDDIFIQVAKTKAEDKR